MTCQLDVRNVRKDIVSLFLVSNSLLSSSVQYEQITDAVKTALTIFSKIDILING